MDTLATRPKAARRYAFACKQCRSRKLRCGGEQPECRRCQRNKEPCQYPARAEEGALEQARQRITELEAALVELGSSKQSSSPASTNHAGSATSPTSRLPLDAGDESDQDDLSPHVGLDEHGELTYHGPTSRFHASALGDKSLCTRTYYNALRERLRNSHVPALESNSDLLHQVWEPLLETKTEMELGAPPALARKLLDFYWTWQHPLHNYVYKPCFIMDFALGGPYFSKFLLHCIFALAARHLDFGSQDNEFANKGETFLVTARALLVEELAAPKPRIPTIQGLLILGGRQCAVGRSSEGWTFSGMAFRMLVDLGLHLNLHHLVEYENLTPADLELRKRLYCSAYIWDKSLSLSLGRPPSLNRLSPAAIDMFDHTDDDVVWRPIEFPNYPATQTLNTTCFHHFCRLGRIVEMIMLPFPNSPSDTAVQDRLSKIEQRLFDWCDQLPEELRMTGLHVPHDVSPCPPPHIVGVNLLYHTLHVILWRPYMQHETFAQHAIDRCTQEAQKVHNIFVSHGRTFHWMRMTYLVSYCVYSAATIDVVLMKSSEKQTREDAAKRLATSLKILECEAQATPGIRRSIDIIKRQLRTWGEPQGRRPSHIPPLQSDMAHHRNTQMLPHYGPPLPIQEANPSMAASASGIPVANPSSQHTMQNQDAFNSWTLDPNAQYNSFANPGTDGMGFEFANTGAGFEPDAFPWANVGDPFEPSFMDNAYYDNYMG